MNRHFCADALWTQPKLNIHADRKKRQRFKIVYVQIMNSAKTYVVLIHRESYSKEKQLFFQTNIFKPILNAIYFLNIF